MVNSNTYFEVLKWASSFLEKNDIETAVAEYLLLEKKEWSKTELLLNLKKEMPESEKNDYQKDLERVVNHIPVQYIIGSCEFYGRRFIVNEDTLIPRPETEELVELVLKENSFEKKQVVDIGTGTGIIAISLKLEKPEWKVTGLDISEKALEIAKKNSERLEVPITFLESDVLSAYQEQSKIDILVSNPPYISYEEWEEMDVSVREFEPKEALFADDSGLAIYKKIASEATSCLAETGKIYLEIGYLQGKAVRDIFQRAFPKKEVTIIKDINGQNRIIKVK